MIHFVEQCVVDHWVQDLDALGVGEFQEDFSVLWERKEVLLLRVDTLVLKALDEGVEQLFLQLLVKVR